MWGGQQAKSLRGLVLGINVGWTTGQASKGSGLGN